MTLTFQLLTGLITHPLWPFSNFGFEQLITTATHIKGKTLNVLLTDITSNLSNVKVNDDLDICKSDHYTIKFEITDTPLAV